MRRILSFTAIVLGCLSTVGTNCACAVTQDIPPATAAEQKAAPLKVLFLGDRGPHAPRERFDILQPLLAERGIEITYTESLDELRVEKLRRYVALIVYANIDRIDAEAEKGLLEYVRGGGGFVPIHCASYCFRNSPDVVAMIGAQFQRHGTGVFREELAEGDHPLVRGYGGFESWDETYVHRLHNETDRTVLSYRVDEEGREPWTWVRSEGKGRVFYTAWGHDSRTWSNPGFANLIERGIRWAAGGDPAEAGDFLGDQPFPIPQLNSLPDDRPEFEYIDVGKKIPHYTPSAQWGTQAEPYSLMQKPVAPEVSMRHAILPKGFRLALFASEPELQGKPIAMAWDERGRLWICETVDYPNELQPPDQGRDRIRICEDTDGDYRADRFVVFAEHLSIPATLTFHRGGVIVQNGTETVYLQDTDGDDVVDRREVWFRGWNQQDTHGGVSNFQYGHDNWIWAMQGYNNSRPRTEQRRFESFRQGFFRFHPDTREIEFIRSTDNNTWGLGISEEGLVFGSTANRNPSVFMPIANRFYERVAGWRTSLTLPSIADTHLFRAASERVRQVDHHGGYTAAAGHALYTARRYPREYWNRTAFVSDPTGHLVGTFVLRPDGAGFRSTNAFNLLASVDEWSAPIMAEVGPDGNVWVIDWYNYIVQHNPTPQGFETGKGAAYETDLRDKTHGRIYRVVYGDDERQPFTLADAEPTALVNSLRHTNLFWRRHAQRLLVERGELDVIPQLLQLVADKNVDEIGLNVGAIHALWTLHGLAAITESQPAVLGAVEAALAHPSAGVRRNALQVLPRDAQSLQAILDRQLCIDVDPQVRLQAYLTLAESPASERAAQVIAAGLSSPALARDRWMRDAATCAAAQHAAWFLAEVCAIESTSSAAFEVAEIVAEHSARNVERAPFDVSAILLRLAESDSPQMAAAIVRGWAAGWPASAKVSLSEADAAALRRLFERLPSAERAVVLQMADAWGSDVLAGAAETLIVDFLRSIDSERESNAVRGERARQLVEFRPSDAQVSRELADRLTPQLDPELAASFVRALALSQSDELGRQILTRINAWTPAVQRQAIDVLLARRTWTENLLESLEQGTMQLTNLSLEQRQALASLSSDSLRARAATLLERGGALPNADRQAVLDEFQAAIENRGDPTAGRAVYTKTCAKCHRHSGEGHDIGPDLTGMAVHPKHELLVHILDPNRSVENNFRMYHVQTLDGLTLSGMLGSESRTAIELIDTQGERRSILREEIDAMRGSELSVMPEGFEKEISLAEMTNLLEFLVQRGKYLPLDLSKVATVASDRGMFYDRNADVERLIFSDWAPQEFRGVPFQLIDPQQGRRANIVLLRGPQGTLTEDLPTVVELPINAPVHTIHFLGGVSGWGYPYRQEKSVSLIVRLHYSDGEQEDHELRNGEHFADYIRRFDVPQSEFAFALRGQQLRYLAIQPSRPAPIAKLALVKGPDPTAPVIMAITVESR